MSSVVFICNLALSNLGKDNISDLSEPSPAARSCNQFYAHTRDTLLQSYPWRFAGRTAALAQVANDRPSAWGYAYSRPIDCLKPRWVRPAYSESDSPVRLGDAAESVAYPFDADGGLIYADLSPAFLRYTRKLTDPTRFSPLFVDALSWHLAVRLAMPMTRDPKVRADAYQLAQATTLKAEAADANEVRESTDHVSEFVEGRA